MRRKIGLQRPVERQVEYRRESADFRPEITLSNYQEKACDFRSLARNPLRRALKSPPANGPRSDRRGNQQPAAKQGEGRQPEELEHRHAGRPKHQRRPPVGKQRPLVGQPRPLQGELVSRDIRRCWFAVGLPHAGKVPGRRQPHNGSWGATVGRLPAVTLASGLGISKKRRGKRSKKMPGSAAKDAYVSSLSSPSRGLVSGARRQAQRSQQ